MAGERRLGERKAPDGGLGALAEELRRQHTPDSAGRCEWCGERYPCEDAAWSAGYRMLVARSAP